MRISIIMVVLVITGCAGANISSQIRESGEPGSGKVLRCVDLSTGSFKSSTKRAYRNVQETVPTGEFIGQDDGENEALKKFDGWKVVYISEYTTPNKSNSAMVMCFEKPFQSEAK